jgi:hypothetical protein
MSPELVLIHEHLGDFCRIDAIRNGQHDLDAVFPESFVVSFEAPLKALSSLVVRQADNE